MSLQFDNKISLGHVLTALAMTVAGVTGYANLRRRHRRAAGVAGVSLTAAGSS